MSLSRIRQDIKMEFQAVASSSKGNSYCVRQKASLLLLEAGVEVSRIQMATGFSVSAAMGCLISHRHLDHAKSAKNIMNMGVDVYVSQETAAALELTGHRLHIIKPLEQFNVGDWKVLPFETEHDCEGSLGFLIADQKGEKLLFATDSYYLKYKFTGLHIIAIECNYEAGILAENVAGSKVDRELKNRVMKSHFSLENVLEFLRANDLSKVREIYLLHLSDSNSDAAKFRQKVAEQTGKEVYVA